MGQEHSFIVEEVLGVILLLTLMGGWHFLGWVQTSSPCNKWRIWCSSQLDLFRCVAWYAVILSFAVATGIVLGKMLYFLISNRAL
ncbi:MAG TPA: hypothetical protein VLA04_05465 [Verrucomicrobiae bacterium]|nr:hypothetical protein [Verrucomicrobiae bacterium]